MTKGTPNLKPTFAVANANPEHWDPAAGTFTLKNALVRMSDYPAAG